LIADFIDTASFSDAVFFVLAEDREEGSSRPLWEAVGQLLRDRAEPEGGAGLEEDAVTHL
jgi:hypothetical protein